MAKRDELIKEIELRLGGQMVDVELDPEHYDLSIRKAFEKYRQRSENAVEEGFIKLLKFYKRMDSCKVPATHKEDGYRLGTWVQTQRRSEDSMSIERRQRLDDIGFIWDTSKDKT